MNQSYTKNCGICGEGVQDGYLSCPRCGSGVFETKKSQSPLFRSEPSYEVITQKKSDKRWWQFGKRSMSGFARDLLPRSAGVNPDAVKRAQKLAASGSSEGLDALEEVIHHLYKGVQEIKFHTPTSGLLSVTGGISKAREALQDIADLARKKLFWRTSPHEIQLLYSTARILYDGEDILEEVKRNGEQEQQSAFWLIIQHLIIHSVLTQNINKVELTAVCDLHNYLFAKRKYLSFGEGFLWPEEIIRSSGFTDLVANARVTNNPDLSLTKEKLLWEDQLRLITAGHFWLICDECMNNSNLSRAC